MNVQRPAEPERVEADAVDCPYRGLAPFAEGDFDYFFGRSKDASQIAAATITENLSVLFGPSGVGKSSVLGAALPRALDAIIDGTLMVYVSRWEPGFYPALLAQASERAGLAATTAPASLEDLAERWIAAKGTPVVFVFDQFEQYFLIPLQEENQDEGIDPSFEVDLARTANRRDLDSHVLISIREDALHELERLRGRLPAILGDPMRLDYLDEPAVRAAVCKPLGVFRERHGDAAGPVEIEDELVAELLARARRAADPQHYETPYLQLVLERLWHEERREGSPVLRLATYDRLHRWEGIANSHVSHTLETCLSEADRALWSAMLDRMVTPSGMKITLPAEDLAAMVKAPAERVTGVLTALGHPESRIIRTVTSAQDPGRKRYEIFHDVLARPLLAWKHAFDAEREQRRMREEAEREQQRLREEAEAERARQQQEIEEQTRRAEEQWRIARRFRRITLAVTILALLSMLFAGWATYSYREAAMQRARVLAMRADLATDGGDSRQAMLLALEALPETASLLEWLRRPILPEAVRALERALFRPFGRTLNGHTDRLVRVAYSPDGGSILTASEDRTVRIWDAGSAIGGAPRLRLQHGSPVGSARFSRDGRFIVTAGQDGWANIWRASDGMKLTEWQISVGRPTFVDLSPDNRLIAAVAYGDNAGLWSWDPDQAVDEAGGGSPPRKVTELRDADGVTDPRGTNYVTFDDGGARVATTSWGGTARIWDAKDAKLVQSLPSATGDHQGRCLEERQGHCGPITFAAFSAANPNLLVTTSHDRTARIWDLAAGKAIRSLVGHERQVTDAAFIGDGGRVMTAALDGTVRIWDAMSGEMLQVLQGPELVAGTSATAALSPDGQTMLASFANPSAYVWAVRGDLQPFVLPRLSDAVPTAALSPDNRLLVAATGISVGPYDAETGLGVGPPLYLDAAAMSVAISPDGNDLLLAGGNRADLLRIEGWSEGAAPRRLHQLHGHDALVLSAVYSPDGKLIVTASQDGTARLRSAGTGKPIAEPLHHRGAVFSAAFNRQGSQVVTASFDGTVRVWTADAGALVSLIDVGAPALEATFTSDGLHVVVTTLEVPGKPIAQPPFFRTETALWDVETGRRVGEQDREALQNVKFLQLANHVVVGTGDGLIRLANALDAEPIAVLPGHRDSISRIVTSPGGQRLATISADGVVRVWKLPPAEPHALVRYANGIADRYLSAEQRQFSDAERTALGLGKHPLPFREWFWLTLRSMMPV
jgi:WD40 repeat protein